MPCLDTVSRLSISTHYCTLVFHFDSSIGKEFVNNFLSSVEFIMGHVMSGFVDLISYICNFALHNSQYFVWFQVNLQKSNSITWLTYLMSFDFWFLHWQLKTDEDKAVFHNNCILNSSASEPAKWRFGADSVTFWVLWYLRVIIDYCYNFTLLEYWNRF